MNGTDRVRRPAVRALAVIFVLMALAGVLLGACAKKISKVDANFTTPDGTGSAEARLVAWPSVLGELDVYEDAPPAGAIHGPDCGRLIPGPGDVLTGVLSYSRYPTGTIAGMIFDHTLANQYQILRREEGGGYAQLNDFALPPSRRWLSSQWEMYSFSDADPSPFQPPTYSGRGLVGGRVVRADPLTNPAAVDEQSIAFISYSGLCNPPDSLFTMQWGAVPGAVRYWINVYRFSTPPDPASLLVSSLPSVVTDVSPNDVFVGFVDTVHVDGSPYIPPATSYRLGDASRSDVTVILRRVTTFGTTYKVRITAVDANGQLIACTPGDPAQIAGVAGDGTFGLFLQGAVDVTPSHPGTSSPDAAALAAREATGGESGPIRVEGHDIRALEASGKILLTRMAPRRVSGGWSAASSTPATPR